MQKLKMFEKPMNRREFLGHSGSLLLALVGISGVIRYVLHHESGSSRIQMPSYGGGSYGGKSKGFLPS